MFYEVVSKRTIVDKKGNDKEISEKFMFENLELFGEAENKMLEFYNNENDVTAIKQSKLMEFVNSRSDDKQAIYLATLESVFIDEETGAEKTTKYLVGVFAMALEDATIILNEYMQQGMQDFVLVSVKKTKIVDLL